MHELRRLKPTTNEIFMRIVFLKFFAQVITSYCSQLCATCAGTKRIIIIRFTALNLAHVIVNIDSEGLRKRKNLQFCVQVYSADIEFQELIREEHKLGVLYCGLTRANFETSFSK